MDNIVGVKDTTEITQISARAIRALCESGEIHGAQKVGKTWTIPREWAEARRAEDYSATHMPLSEAAKLSGLTRQGLIDRIKAGKIKGFARPALQRNRWLVERDSFATWLSERVERKS